MDTEIFEAHGFVWKKHTPGEPMPCDGDAVIDVLLSLPVPIPIWNRRADSFDWGKSNIKTGWRFADSEQKEPAGIDWVSVPCGWAAIAPVGVPVVAFDGDMICQLKAENITRYLPGTTADLSEYVERAEDEGVPYALYGVDQIKVGGVTYYRNEPGSLHKAVQKMVDALANGTFNQDESERNDLIAAVDDGHLTPGQKAYIQGKEDAQAAKQQIKHDAEAKALQERADQLADAGKAMDVIRDGFTHKLGWMA